MPEPLTIDELRKYLRDKPELNSLTDGLESEDADLQSAISDAIDEYNILPPVTHFVNSNFPSKALLKIGATLWVLKSVGIFMSRNHLTYSDGGINVEVHEKTQLYQSWIDRLQPQWDKAARQIKTEMNINSAYGGVSSQYATTGFFY